MSTYPNAKAPAFRYQAQVRTARKWALRKAFIVAKLLGCTFAVAAFFALGSLNLPY